jgi:hypothetical protein
MNGFSKMVTSFISDERGLIEIPETAFNIIIIYHAENLALGCYPFRYRTNRFIRDLKVIF